MIGFTGTSRGKKGIIRSQKIISCDVVISDDVQTIYNVIIHGGMGIRVPIGTATMIEGNTIIGAEVNLQIGVYIPPRF